MTSRKLEVSKCFWIPINWGWKRGYQFKKKKKKAPRSRGLYLQESESGDLVKIPLLSPSEAPKRLGIHYSIDGSWTAEYNYWKQFTVEYSADMKKARLDRLGGIHAYATLWCAKFRYSSPCIGFNRAKLTSLGKKSLHQVYQSLGFCQKCPGQWYLVQKDLGG